jgi:hypothetical protein
MNMTEMGSQLGRDTAASLKEQADRVDLAVENMREKELKTQQGEFEARLVSVAEALGELAKLGKQTILDFQTATKETRQVAQDAYYQAKNAATRLEEAAARLPLKMWVTMCLVGVLSGPASVSAYWIWQHRSAQEKEQAASWRGFQEKFHNLHVIDQKEVMRIMSRKR